MTLIYSQDSIYALSTPPGKSGVAVVRVSGSAAADSLSSLGVSPLPAPRMATLATLRAVDGSPIDRALVLYFAAPASFTGEDIAEYHIHGGRAVIQSLLRALAAVPGLRLAEPGEFMRRAFLNGKCDLTAVEGLADLIDAESSSQHRQAFRLMQGEAARFFEGLRHGIVHALAYLEAYIDFPEEEIPEHVLSEIRSELLKLSASITEQLGKARIGETIREGLRIAIIGPPNAGKSSLLNLLARRDIAIVSPIAGTTRDVLEAHLELGGYSVTFVDTAGIREHAQDSIEQEGIRRSRREAEQADMTLLLLDAAQPGEQGLKDFAEGPQALRVFNKADMANTLPADAMAISVQTGQGVQQLLGLLEERIAALYPAESVLVTRERHVQHLTQALVHIHAFLQEEGLPLELQCEILRSAALEIGKITGIIAVDELLGHIFASFCIGK